MRLRKISILLELGNYSSTLANYYCRELALGLGLINILSHSPPLLRLLAGILTISLRQKYREVSRLRTKLTLSRTFLKLTRLSSTIHVIGPVKPLDITNHHLNSFLAATATTSTR